MPKRIAFVEAEINRRLAAVVTPDVLFPITAAELRKWARQYLATMDREYLLPPMLPYPPHCNLWLRDDSTSFFDAHFVVLTFRAECLEFYCGVGTAINVRGIALPHSNFAPHGLREAMQSAFGTEPSFLRIARDAAALWLGRGWKPSSS